MTADDRYSTKRALDTSDAESDAENKKLKSLLQSTVLSFRDHNTTHGQSGLRERIGTSESPIENYFEDTRPDEQITIGYVCLYNDAIRCRYTEIYGPVKSSILIFADPHWHISKIMASPQAILHLHSVKTICPNPKYLTHYCGESFVRNENSESTSDGASKVLKDLIRQAIKLNTNGDNQENDATYDQLDDPVNDFDRLCAKLEKEMRILPTQDSEGHHITKYFCTIDRLNLHFQHVESREKIARILKVLGNVAKCEKMSAKISIIVTEGAGEGFEGSDCEEIKRMVVEEGIPGLKPRVLKSYASIDGH